MSETRVYFVRGGNLVKIGVAEKPIDRLAALQVGSPVPLILVGELPGDERYERLLHSHFGEYAVHGEWFRCAGRLADFIALLPEMPSRDEAIPKNRTRVKQEIPEALKRSIKERWAAASKVVTEMVYEFGLSEFADLVGASASHVSDALQSRCRKHWRAEWTLALKSVSRAELVRLLNDIENAPAMLALMDAEVNR